MCRLLRTAVAVGMWMAGAVAGVVGVGGVGVARGQTVEFRIVEREGQTAITSTADVQLNLAVQARVVGAVGGVGVGSFLFNVAMPDEPEAYGTLARGLITNPDGTYAGPSGVSNAIGSGGLARQYTFLAGISSQFNGVINMSAGTFVNSSDQEIGLISGAAAGTNFLGTPGIDTNNDGVPDSYTGSGTTATMDPAIAASYFGAQGTWVDVYRFRYTVGNLTSRTLRFELRGVGVQVFSGLRIANGLWATGPGGGAPSTAAALTVNVAVTGNGACCNAQGGCTVSSGVACAGSFMAGTCTPNPCPPTGACCSATDVCTTVLRSACTGLTWTAGACVPMACGGPGACCGLDCQVTTIHNCPSGRTWMAGTCSPSPCPPPGGCCSSSNVCTVTLQLGCSGVTWTAGTCEATVCGMPGACCGTECQLLGVNQCPSGSTWMAGTCTPNPCPPTGACCGTDCQVLTQHNCTGGRVWMMGVCSPNPCPPPLACCNAGTGACSVVAPVSDVVYTFTYFRGHVGYGRNDAGGTVESISATFSPVTRRLVFDVSLSGVMSGTPLITRGFWLVLDNGPDPKHHAGELAIFYFDATVMGSPRMTVYGYNGVDANTSWRDGDAGTAGDQTGDLIKGLGDTAYIHEIVAEDLVISGQGRRHFKFDIDASDILAHVPQYPAGSPWYGTGFDRSLGLWFHPVGNWNATYDSGFGGVAGRITSLTTSDEGWLDGSGRGTSGTDPCLSGQVAAPGKACTPSNTCPQLRACCGASSGVCVVVGPRDDCPDMYVFATPGASSCSPNPCPTFALQASGVCCNALTGACCVVPRSGCTPTTHVWQEAGACGTGVCPESQGACCNVVTGGCGVTTRTACGPAAHEWSAGGTCSPNTCDVPGICCNTAAGTCRRATHARCGAGSTWSPTGTCAPNPCGAAGRCCNVVTGACQMTVQSACAPMGHEWMPGMACAPNPCSMPGACCSAAGTCRRLTEARCGDGGVWAAGACSPNPCGAAGRCCNVVTGACQMMVRSSCLPAGHDWTPGATCSPNPCDAPGVCCNLGTGTCRRLTEARCGSGAVWVPSGVCAPSPCAMPQGACCNVVTGSCAVAMQAECAPAAHDWVPGGACSPNACAAAAACCTAGGVCRRLTEVRCMSVGGTWMSGQACFPSPCAVQAVAVCMADFDRSSQVNVQDVLSFVGAWFATDARADVNDDGEVDVMDTFDFLAAWFVGCG